MILSIIAAVGENGEIGGNGNLLCRLPADLQHFKKITSGHTVIMGRKTFESLPKGPLPNRRNIVISRNANLKISGAEIYTSIASALSVLREEDEVFVIGGAQIYGQTAELAERIYLTRIHASFPEADAFFPETDFSAWTQTGMETFPADDKNPYPFTFFEYTFNN
jgi:dihydrofolate reductase